MRYLVLSGVFCALAAPAVAGATDPVVIYPFATSVNYCPAGLQPVTFDGRVSCGKPTTDVTYQQATAEPRRYHGGSRVVCPVGAKGC